MSERIAICQHPNGEGVWWTLDARDDGSRCIQDCDCTPKVYVDAVTAQGAVARARGLAEALARCPDDHTVAGVREVGAEIAALLGEP